MAAHLNGSSPGPDHSNLIAVISGDRNIGDASVVAALNQIVNDHIRRGDRMDRLQAFLDQGLASALTAVLRGSPNEASSKTPGGKANKSEDGDMGAKGQTAAADTVATRSQVDEPKLKGRRMAVLTLLGHVARDVDSEVKRQVVDEVMAHTVDLANASDADIRLATLSVLSSFARFGYAAIRIMLFGGVPTILNHLRGDPATTKVALAVLAKLALHAPVRTLISELLTARADNVKHLAELCRARDLTIGFFASTSVALLMQVPDTAARFVGHRAEEFLETFGQRDPLEPDLAVPWLESDLIPLMALLTAHGELPQTIFLWTIARATNDNLQMAPHSAAIIPLVRSKMARLLRSYALSTCVRHRTLAATTLQHIGDPEWVRIKDINTWLATVGLGQPFTWAAGKAWKKEGVTLDLLVDPGLTKEQLEALVNSTNLKLPGVLTRLTLAVNRLRSEVLSGWDSRGLLRQEAEQAERPLGASLQGIARAARQSVDERNDAGDKQQHDVFISYCWANKPAAKQVRDLLVSAGLTYWMDEQQMAGGDALFDAIDDGITNSKIFMACVSNKYGLSQNCRREITSQLKMSGGSRPPGVDALARSQVRLATDRGKIIIPIIIGETTPYPPRGDMGPLLAGKIYVDVSTEDKLSSAGSQLVEALMASL